jgi:hypothetical protein
MSSTRVSASFSVVQRAQSCRAAAMAVAMVVRVAESDEFHVWKKAT